MDSSMANYRVNWRKRKWWWPLFSWSLSVQAVNAWRLKQRFTGKKEPYLKFLRDLIVCLLTQHGTKPVTARRSLEIPIHLRDNIRYPNYLPNYLTT